MKTSPDKKSLRRRLLHHVLPPALLFVLLLVFRSRTAWVDWYSLHFYPVWSGIASRISSWVPFSLDEVVIVAAIAGVVFCLFRLRRRWTTLVALLLWLLVWASIGWELNYYRSDIFARAGKQAERFDPRRFQRFLDDYAQELNGSYLPWNDLDKDAVEQEVKQYYTALPARWGLTQPKAWQRPKKLMFKWVLNSFGVSGYVGMFASEIQINNDAPNREYPFLFAHELSHLLGVSNEAEANYWAYSACTASARPEIRYAGLQSLLPYVLTNAKSALSEAEYEQFVEMLRPEVMEVYQAEKDHWLERYSPTVGRISGWFYDLYLRSHRIPSGKANYNEVIRILLTLSKPADLPPGEPSPQS